jgi:hypothetical protein
VTRTVAPDMNVYMVKNRTSVVLDSLVQPAIVDSPDSHKQDLKGHECKLLGIDEERKDSYLVYDLFDKKVCTSRDLTFPTE